MKRRQLSMETLENRELLTTIVEPVTEYTYDTVGNRLSITDDSGVEDRGASDTQIYTLEILDIEPATQNQLWGDWFFVDDAGAVDDDELAEQDSDIRSTVLIISEDADG